MGKPTLNSGSVQARKQKRTDRIAKINTENNLKVVNKVVQMGAENNLKVVNKVVQMGAENKFKSS